VIDYLAQIRIVAAIIFFSFSLPGALEFIFFTDINVCDSDWVRNSDLKFYLTHCKQDIGNKTTFLLLEHLIESVLISLPL